MHSYALTMACLCVDLRNKDIGHRKYFLMNALGTYLSQNLQSRNSLNIYPENVSIKSLLTEAIATKPIAMCVLIMVRCLRGKSGEFEIGIKYCRWKKSFE
jgi:hypothetical protein